MRKKSDRMNGRLSITVTLATAISLLVLVATGSVLSMGLGLARKNTLSLLRINANQNIQSTVDQLNLYLRPAEHQVRFVTDRLIKGEVSVHDRESFGSLLLGALAAAPQIEAISYIDPNLKTLVAQQNPDLVTGLMESDYAKDAQANEIWASLPDQTSWSPPIWRDEHAKSYFNYFAPVELGNDQKGVVVASVSIREISEFLSGFDSNELGHRFILYGRHNVLAHPLLVDGYPGLSVRQSLPRLDMFGDPVLRVLWQEENRMDLETESEHTEGTMISTEDESYIVVYRSLEGFGPDELIVGAYVPMEDLGDEIHRIRGAIFIGVGLLLLAILAAIFLGKRIARPIKQFSEAVTQVRQMDIGKMRALPGSIFRELNDQSKSFNAMLRALRWFELYIPKKIVTRLVQRDSAEDMQSSVREITVMFTDIAGFSTISEGMSAAQVAELVNRHFEIVAGCIEAEGGTVDKFIGDSVMAFWNAPDPQADGPQRACHAALAMRESIQLENRNRQKQGLPPIRMRIGIHIGEATVGNIGAPGRINYTIIGDSVNIGQRLEQLGKKLAPAETEVAVVLSREVADSLGEGFDLIPGGRHHIKGREADVEVLLL